jgi:4a-hydroxytetrahydrobiopterin dehydratase
MLKKKDCVPCKKGTPALTLEQAAGYLGFVEGWDIAEEGKVIIRSFKFDDFKNALAFVNAVGEVAEIEKHHPDITFGWGYCTVLFTTHAIKGLHENDFIMAAKVNEIAGV